MIVPFDGLGVRLAGTFARDQLDPCKRSRKKHKKRNSRHRYSNSGFTLGGCHQIRENEASVVIINILK
jgi:hypothetical protein